MTDAASPPRRAVLFDFGDTLVCFGPVDKKAMFEKAAWRTYRMWARRNRRMPDYRRFYLHHWFAMRWQFAKTLVLRRELDTMRMLRRASRKLWLSGSSDFFEELAWNWYKPLAEVATVEPCTPDVLQKLTDDGYQLAIVSNTFIPGFVLDRHLAQLGLLHFFPTRIYSSDVGYRKPSPRIFQAALEALEVPAHHAAFIGDLPEIDLRGARRVGMHAVWRRPPEAHETVPEDCAVIDSLGELPEALQRFFG